MVTNTIGGIGIDHENVIATLAFAIDATRALLHIGITANGVKQMLKFFEIEKTFHDTVVRLYVDIVNGAADLTVTYNRRIVARETYGLDQSIKRFGREEWVKLSDVDGAQKFLSRDMGEQGNFVEAMEWRGKRNLFA